MEVQPSCTSPFYVDLDMEFNRSNDPNPQLVSCALQVDGDEVEKYWLHKDVASQLELRTRLQFLKDKGAIFVCWAAEAEARSMLSLGINDCHKWESSWMDLYLEYRNLQNHSWELMFGEQLVQNKETKKWSVKRLNPYQDSKGSAGLVAATYKLLKIRLDGEHKDRMRDLILSDPDEFNEEQKQQILDYNASDIKYLSMLRKKMNELYKQRLSKDDIRNLRKEALLRGNYAARTAKMVQQGYPINYEQTKNFSDNVPVILDTTIKDILSQDLPMKPFRWDKKSCRYSMNQKLLQEWIQSSGLANGWELTDKGKLSLSLDAFKAKFNFRHNFPENNLGAQMVRYLNIKQSLNGFVNKAGKDEKSFWDYVGSDRRVRPYFNIYGAQSSRSQPSATGYIHLKAAWMRSLVQPPVGSALCGTDYSSQEFLIGAILSGDARMFEAYSSGDPYLYYGKAFGVIPKEGTKETHGKERDACKATVLAMMFMMSEFGLADKLTQDTGIPHDTTQALEYIDGFNEIFDVFANWRKETIELHAERGYLRLLDGWTMWKDNRNFRSVANMSVQGHGGVVMRQAVRLCQNADIAIPLTLHDALYAEAPTQEMLEKTLDLKFKLMRQGFIESFPKHLQDKASVIRMDQEVWSLDFPVEKGIVETPSGRKVPRSHIYVDKRAAKEYDKYKEFFTQGLNLESL